MDERETPCQLYLIIPPEMDQDMAAGIAAMGESGNIACTLLRCDANGEINRKFANEFMPMLQDAKLPVLFENDIAAARELGADGVHISADEKIYTECRCVLGDDAIIGVECGHMRHDGLTFGEMGADYIAFTEASRRPRGWNEMELEELIIWWSETVTIPCVAWDISGADEARRYARAGADFVAVGAPIWSHAKGPGNAVAEFSTLLRAETLTA